MLWAKGSSVPRNEADLRILSFTIRSDFRAHNLCATYCIEFLRGRMHARVHAWRLAQRTLPADLRIPQA